MTLKRLFSKTPLFALIAILPAVFGPGVLHAADGPDESAAIIGSERPSVEVVFVLDTTGSMGGLIAAAKDKIWSIANTLASADPAPQIKMGLVGYRDRGDAYITILTPLSDDLDAVYSLLMQFRADGGGDGPESVNQALYEAITRPDWSRDPAAYRVIFLVGDAPPHMDYQDDIRYAESCRLAIERDIVINTIQCGAIAETTPVWRRIAHLAEGRYFQVEQSGGAVLYDTPYDERIAALSAKLDATRIYYGDKAQIAAMEDRKREAEAIYDAAAPAAVAKRTIFNASGAGSKNFLGSQELVADVTDGGIDLANVEKAALPEDLQAMSLGEREAYVAGRAAERRALQEKITELGKKRQAFIADRVKEAGGGEKSLDAQLYRCIQTQAEKKEIRYTGGPSY